MCRYIIAIVLTIALVAVLWKSFFHNLTSHTTIQRSTIEQQNSSTTSNLSDCGFLKADHFFNLRKTVEPNEFPWMATLLSHSPKIQYLSVLINKRHLLAAAHCFNDRRDAKRYIVGFGNCTSKNFCITAIKLETFVQHPKYIVNEPAYDISLLRLQEPVTITDYIQPICLPSANSSAMNFVGQYVTLTGCQKLGGFNAKLPVLVIDFIRCKKAYNLHALDNNILCASTCDNGSMFVSGSILMAVIMRNSLPIQYYLIGLLTFSKDGCMDSSPDIFQRIDSHIEWITQNIDKLEHDFIEPK